VSFVLSPRISYCPIIDALTLYCFIALKSSLDRAVPERRRLSPAPDRRRMRAIHPFDVDCSVAHGDLPADLHRLVAICDRQRWIKTVEALDDDLESPASVFRRRLRLRRFLLEERAVSAIACEPRT